MKKTIFLLILSSLFSQACRKKNQLISDDPWAAYRQAYDLLNINRDSAFLHFNRIAENSKEKQQIALAYYNMALIQSDAGDVYGAQESLVFSVKSLDERQETDRGYLAGDFNELSLTSYNLKDYKASLDYADKALSLTEDSAIREHIFINRGNALQKLQQYDLAVRSYRQTIAITGKTGSIFARAVTNIAMSKWLDDPHFDAAPDLKAALRIHTRANDLWGQNASYAHLADFYMYRSPDSALHYAQEMLRIAGKLKSGDDQLEALQKLAKLASSADIRQYFLRYQSLNDSLVTVRKAAKNQFAVIRYDVEKNKADNLRLQQENTLKKYQLGGAFALLLSLATGGFFWYRRKRVLAKLETEAKVGATRIHLSKKVHDVVANGIYAVMNEVEHSEELVKEELLDKLEIMYEQSRDISHERPDRSPTPFHEDLVNLLKVFKNPDIRLALAGNEETIWKQVSETIKSELKPAILELLVNMRKHSRASQALLSFSIEGEQLLVSYRDNGIGLTVNVTGGTGIQNTVSRIQAIGGEVTFASGALNGAEITLTIPLN